MRVYERFKPLRKLDVVTRSVCVGPRARRAPLVSLRRLAPRDCADAVVAPAVAGGVERPLLTATHCWTSGGSAALIYRILFLKYPHDFD